MVDAEVARRGISCETALAHNVSDCSSLQVVEAEQVERGYILAVRNNGSLPRQFRAGMNGIATRLQTVGPGQTHRFGIEASMPLRAAGTAVAVRQNNMGVQLGECTVPY